MKKIFVLRIGNNDICEGEFTETVVKLGIDVEEAETSPGLCEKYARDCMCGVRKSNLLRRLGIVENKNSIVS